MNCPECGKELNIKDIIFNDGGIEIVVGSFCQCDNCGYFINEMFEDTESGIIN